MACRSFFTVPKVPPRAILLMVPQLIDFSMRNALSRK
jgi:hypothetical protein